MTASPAATKQPARTAPAIAARRRGGSREIVSTGAGVGRAVGDPNMGVGRVSGVGGATGDAAIGTATPAGATSK